MAYRFCPCNPDVLAPQQLSYTDYIPNKNNSLQQPFVINIYTYKPVTKNLKISFLLTTIKTTAYNNP